MYLQEMVDLACSDISTNQTPTSPHYQVRGRRYVCIYAIVLMGCNRLDRLLLSCQDVTVLTTLTIFAMCGFLAVCLYMAQYSVLHQDPTCVETCGATTPELPKVHLRHLTVLY